MAAVTGTGAAAVVVTSAAVAAHGTAHPLWALGTLAVTTGAVSAFVTLRSALAYGVALGLRYARRSALAATRPGPGVAGTMAGTAPGLRVAGEAGR